MSLVSLQQKFAALALGSLNLQSGQSLAIKMEPENLDTAVAVANLAYRKGARYVDLWPESSRMLRSRVDNSEGSFLDFAPRYRSARNQEFLDERWALLSIKSPIDPTIMDGASPTRTGAIARTESIVDADLRRGLSTDLTQWTVMAVPTPRWAGQVLQMAPDDAALSAMWDALRPILRLDEPDPGAFWHQHGLLLEERAKQLTAMQIKILHFEDQDTDLKVTLSPDAVWKGGGAHAANGIRFAPNIPTEEVFTTPDYRETRGRVRLSRPVRVLGQMLDDAWMEFRDGRVVNVGASRGVDALNTFLDVDAGSRSMGEIALVDSSSPIFQSGLLFNNILLDENAACHFALGFAYPTCITGGAEMSDAELEGRGANRSRQHLDFMIGTGRTRVTAITRSGETRPIIEEGSFVL